MAPGSVRTMSVRTWESFLFLFLGGKYWREGAYKGHWKALKLYGDSGRVQTGRTRTELFWAHPGLRKEQEIRVILEVSFSFPNPFFPRTGKRPRKCPVPKRYTSHPHAVRRGEPQNSEVCNKDPNLLTTSLRKIFGDRQIEKIGKTNIAEFFFYS